MKPTIKTICTVIFLLQCVVTASGQNLSATDVVRLADEKFNGELSGIVTMKMTIVRPTWERSVEFKSWSKGTEKSLTLITAPARDKGQTFLKSGTEMWNWNPVISRLIKLPPSMMSQGWMGSDYTNDDIMRESSVVKDYNHRFDGEETIEGRLCYKIVLTARPDSPVLWSRQIQWIDKKELIILKAELYDEDEYLVRTELGHTVKTFDGRLLPSVMEIIPADKDGQKTVVEIIDIKFNVPIEDSFFSQQNMKRVR